MKFKSHKNKFCNEKEAKKLFQILPFYNVLIERPKIMHLSKIELLNELPFYDDLSVVEISTAQKMKFSVMDFFCKCDQICSFLWVWSHLLKKSLMENSISSAVIKVT